MMRGKAFAGSRMMVAAAAGMACAPAFAQSGGEYADICEPGECCPPSTGQRVMIGAADAVLFVVLVLLFMRLMERRFIQLDKDARLGRHLGISLALLVASGGMLALQIAVTGCIVTGMWLWVGFVFALFVLHGLYTLVVVRTTA